MLKTFGIRAVAAAGAVVSVAAALPSQASAVDMKTPVRASVKVTERQDWEVVKPTTHGCSAVGGGSEVMHVQGSRRVVLSQAKEDSHRPYTTSLSLPAAFSFELADDTTRTPPEVEGGNCGEDPRDCGSFAVGRHRLSAGSSDDRGRVEVTPIYPPERRNCFTPPRQFPWYLHRAVARWTTKRWAAGRPGKHTVRVTRRFPPETVRGTDYGDIRVTGTVTFELAYHVVGPTRLVR